MTKKAKLVKSKAYRALFMALLWGLFALPAAAAPLVAVSAGKDQETITLTLAKASPRKIFTLSDPDRLVVDVPSLGKRSVSLGSYKGTLISNVRAGQFNADTSRIVFELQKPVQVTAVSAKGTKEVELRISIAPASKMGKVNISTKVEKVKKPEIAEKPLIVIDPGHGGVDPGTIGPGGMQEKNVVLEYAKGLKAKLLATGKYRVQLTRDTDKFIILRNRFGIARKAKADLFISVHADSAPDAAARGLSVYTLSEKASDQEAEALAAQENKADVLAGVDLSDEREDVADILISLAQRETKNRSASLADKLVKALDDRVTLLPNSHRFAGFAVLKAPDIPSVLIETGFLSHPLEEKQLKTKAYRDKVIAGVVAGIDAYFREQQSYEAQ